MVGLRDVNQQADFCWVSADGVLKSGTKQDLFACVSDGSLPGDHPVFRQGWPEWLPLAEAIAKGYLENPIKPPVIQLPGPTVSILAIPNAGDWVEDEVTLPRPPSYRHPVLTQSGSEPPPGVVRTLPPPRQPIALPAVIGSGVALFGALMGVAILAIGHLSAPPRTLHAGALRVPRSSPTPVAPTAAVSGCKAVSSPFLLSERAAPFAPIATSSLGDDWVLVGVTSNEKTGFGFVIGLAPMHRRAFSTPEFPVGHIESREIVADPVHLAAVVPIARDESRFVADRWWTTLATQPDHAIGLTPTGFSWIKSGGEQIPIWPGDAAAIISRPRVARAANGDFAVAFRRGDRVADGYESGSIRFGWIGSGGEKKSELTTLYEQPGKLELPAVAASETGAWVAFAARGNDDREKWRISIASAASGALPTSRRVVELAGHGLSERAVSLAALENGRYVAVFAEGDRNQSAKIGLRVLGERGPTEPALTLASSSDQVRSTAIQLTAGRGLVLFTEKTERSFDRLWSIAVDCR